MVPTSLLTDLVTIADVRYVFFRCAPDSAFQADCHGSRQPDDWPAPVVTPLSDEFGPAQYDYDAMTNGHAIELNGLIEDRLESVKRHSSQALSEVSLTRKMLQKRHDSDTALIHGSTRSYPGSTNTSPLDPMASVLGDDFDGANRRARDFDVARLWSTDSWKRKYLEQLDQEGFHAQFADLRRMRFKFLIIHGESCMGKTQFAKWATGGQNPWVVGSGFYLRGYNERLYDVIIFNDVANIDKKSSSTRRCFNARRRSSPSEPAKPTGAPSKCARGGKILSSP